MGHYRPGELFPFIPANRALSPIPIPIPQEKSNMSSLFEQLEARQFFSATILGINWVNSAGSTLANNLVVADDSVVTARILTVSSRGQSGNVFLFEDDGILGKSLVRTVPFKVP